MARFPAFQESIAKLKGWGVHMIYGGDLLPLFPPGTGGRHRHEFPWHLALEALETARAGGPDRPGHARASAPPDAENQ
jgi:hypothetical protein